MACNIGAIRIRSVSETVRLAHSTRPRRVPEGVPTRLDVLAGSGVDILNMPWQDWTPALVALTRRAGLRPWAWDAHGTAGIERALDLGARSNKTIVADYIFEKDKLFACLNLNDQELDTYNRYFNYFREQLPTPDLVIYLQATPDVLKKRLKKKNAPGEKAISEDYLMEVVKAYEHFFFHYTQSDLLIVNTSEIDFVDRNADAVVVSRRSAVHGYTSACGRGGDFFRRVHTSQSSAERRK